MSRDEVLSILAEHKAELVAMGVKSIAIFGSTARNEAGADSDVDILVEFSAPVGMFKFLDVKARLESILGREVDLATPDALRQQMRPRILKEAIRAI
ncbi:MAG: nucleotidyltransferase family protein [Armatimonadetes bacterium]|nr:nucleotidyltransferase family protein [Armatimonadota bacterium]